MNQPPSPSDPRLPTNPDDLPVLSDASTLLDVAWWACQAVVSGTLANLVYENLKAWFNRKGPASLPEVKRAALALLEERSELAPEVKAQVRKTIEQTFDRLERDL